MRVDERCRRERGLSTAARVGSMVSVFSVAARALGNLSRKVCGLNKKTAAGLVALREKNGRILSREEIRTVKGLGAKSYEQCAGEILPEVLLTQPWSPARCWSAFPVAQVSFCSFPHSSAAVCFLVSDFG